VATQIAPNKKCGIPMNNGNMHAKHIVINGRFLSQSVTGVQRYAVELLKSLDLLLSTGALESIPVTVFIPPNAHTVPSYSFLRVRRVGHLTGQLWEQLELPLFARGSLLFTPCGGAPILHDCHVVTIPDAAVFATPTAYSLLYRTWYRWLHSRLCKKAQHILTVSQFSKSELIRWCAVDPSRVSVTYLGCNHAISLERDNSILKKYDLDGCPYIFAVSSRNPNKNFGGIVEAISLLDMQNIKVVIAGGVNSRVFETSYSLPSHVQEVGYITDAELRSLYQHAKCFLFPSFYEGFGLPSLEAMVNGCPVIAAKTASLSEICGEAALYCDPSSPENIATQIRTVLRDEKIRNKLILDGIRQAGKFLWEGTARQTWEVLQAAATRRADANRQK
jgi:glycosyltransferase involved in cell wall biosynthesis